MGGDNNFPLLLDLDLLYSSFGFAMQVQFFISVQLVKSFAQLFAHEFGVNFLLISHEIFSCREAIRGS